MKPKRRSPGEVTAICKAAGISQSTFYSRLAAGLDPTAPPLLGAARARNALKASPWRKSSRFKTAPNPP